MFCALREAEGIEINMKTVIMAGGRGTRIAGLNPKVPKPMIRMEGMPILEHQLSVLRRQGFTDVVLTVGYLGQNIQDYFGDGSKVSPVTGYRHEPLCPHTQPCFAYIETKIVIPSYHQMST